MATTQQTTQDIVSNHHDQSVLFQPQPGGEHDSSVETPPSSPPPPRHDIRAEHYEMLINGHIRTLAERISSERLINLKLSYLRTPNSSTILHIAASAGQVNLIRPIIEHDNDILYCRNSDGDLPIHVAVKAGQLPAVSELLEVEAGLRNIYNTSIVEFDNQLESENNNEEKNTALHIALDKREKKMAEVLFGKCPQTFYKLNAKGICPLYLAIKAGFWDLVRDMIRVEERDKTRVENALLGGKSVVHAALCARNQEIVKKMVSKYPKLIKALDEKGRTTLSYAAEIGFVEGFQCLFRADALQALEPDSDNCFPIHWACLGGNVATVKLLFSLSPDILKWLPNKEGQNILHLASRNGQNDVVRFLLGKAELENLINMNDGDGNTPLHVATLGKHPRVVHTLTRDNRVQLMLRNKQGFTPLDLAQHFIGPQLSFEERLTWMALQYANAPGSPLIEDHQHQFQSGTTNNENPLMMRTKYKDRINALLMLCTFIATMAFASNFTIPGGYNQDRGRATLAHQRAFQVFVFNNTIALYSSTFAAVNLIWAHLEDVRLSLLALNFALPSLGVAFVTMSVASTTGLFVALQSVCNWLATLVLAMGCIFVLLVLCFFIPLYSPLPPIRNKVGRCVSHLSFSLMLLTCDYMANHDNHV